MAQQCKENIFAIQTLKDFQFVEDNKDQGLNVREKAKALVTLLKAVMATRSVLIDCKDGLDCWLLRRDEQLFTCPRWECYTFKRATVWSDLTFNHLNSKLYVTNRTNGNWSNCHFWMKDDERLKNERTRALKAKERFAQSTQGMKQTPEHVGYFFVYIL